MARHRKEEEKPQTINDTEWHCGNCNFRTKNTDAMAAHAEICIPD